jgi:signal transduction histidine kinase
VGTRAAGAAGGALTGRELDRRRQIERWVSWVRLGAVPFAIVEVGLLTSDYPPGYAGRAWTLTGILAAGAALVWWLARRPLAPRGVRTLGLSALAFDTLLVAGFVVLYYSFELNSPIQQLLVLPVAEAAVRFGVLGGVVVPLLLVPALVLGEALRSDRLPPFDFDPDAITFPLGVEIMMGLLVGWLASRLGSEAVIEHLRAAEAERLRDQLGRRADQLDSVNRAGRALASSLSQEQAFEAFLREVKGMFAFERLAVVLVQGDRSEVLVAAGPFDEAVFPPGTSLPIANSLLEEVLAGGQTVLRRDMAADPRFPEEEEFVAAGLRSRVVAPLSLGDRPLGILSVVRAEADGFAPEDVELIALVARQVATAVENIRVFEAERNAAEELRRLSALRADFVSLVSHELRAPMASVIGCAQTLRRRWRELQPDQRESFLALIEGETSRLAALIGDVLDTSRIEAGTFPIRFGQVDVEELVRETTAVVSLGQDEVSMRTDIAPSLPPVRGDRERLRQLVLNLLTNAVKYTVAGGEIEVMARVDNGSLALSVRDHGPGISPEEQRLIFEKFGRVNQGGKSKPGAGLGLFIARSIAEAHGGTLVVDSQLGAGARFVLRLPLARP